MLLQPTTRSNFSLGSEYYRNGDYCAAYPYIKQILATEPLFTGEDPDDRNYLRMASIYEDFAANVDSTNQAERVAYLDSALTTRQAGVAALERELGTAEAARWRGTGGLVETRRRGLTKASYSCCEQPTRWLTLATVASFRITCSGRERRDRVCTE